MGYDQGNYTGSGLSMKFADANGKIINVYQQLNNVYDQQYMEHEDQDGYFNAFKGIMDRSVQHGVYSTISVRAHNNEYFFSKVPLMKMLDYANQQGIPVWTELKFLEFLRAKEETTINDITWADNQLSYTIHSALKHENGITHLIPYMFNTKKMAEVRVNGSPYAYRVQEIKGRRYASVIISPGSMYSFVIRYRD
jgi:large repetitive protein